MNCRSLGGSWALPPARNTGLLVKLEEQPLRAATPWAVSFVIIKSSTHTSRCFHNACHNLFGLKYIWAVSLPQTQTFQGRTCGFIESNTKFVSRNIMEMMCKTERSCLNAEAQTMAPPTWGKIRSSKACRQIHCHWIFCHGSKNLKVQQEQIMHWDRLAHSPLLWKHHHAHRYWTQDTQTKSRTVVYNELQPSSQSCCAHRPRSLGLHQDNKKPGGPQLGSLSLWHGHTERCGRGNDVTIPFLTRPTPVRAPYPARSRKPGLKMCWLTAAWFLAVGSGF